MAEGAGGRPAGFIERGGSRVTKGLTAISCTPGHLGPALKTVGVPGKQLEAGAQMGVGKAIARGQRLAAQLAGQMPAMPSELRGYLREHPEPEALPQRVMTDKTQTYLTRAANKLAKSQYSNQRQTNTAERWLADAGDHRAAAALAKQLNSLDCRWMDSLDALYGNTDRRAQRDMGVQLTHNGRVYAHFTPAEMRAMIAHTEPLAGALGADGEVIGQDIANTIIEESQAGRHYPPAMTDAARMLAQPDNYEALADDNTHVEVAQALGLAKCGMCGRFVSRKTGHGHSDSCGLFRSGEVLPNGAAVMVIGEWGQPVSRCFREGDVQGELALGLHEGRYKDPRVHTLDADDAVLDRFDFSIMPKEDMGDLPYPMVTLIPRKDALPNGAAAIYVKINKGRPRKFGTIEEAEAHLNTLAGGWNEASLGLLDDSGKLIGDEDDIEIERYVDDAGRSAFTLEIMERLLTPDESQELLGLLESTGAGGNCTPSDLARRDQLESKAGDAELARLWGKAGLDEDGNYIEPDDDEE